MHIAVEDVEKGLFIC